MSQARPFVPRWLDELALKPNQFRVYCNLWRRADSQGISWPAAETIAADCRINRDTVWAVLTELEAAGLIERSKGYRNSNRYRVLIPVGGNEGPTQSAETDGLHSTENRGLQSAETDGCESAETRGRKGNPRKVIQERESKEGGEAPTPAVEFPWSGLDDPSLPPAVTNALADAFHEATVAARVFTAIRGRKIRYRDQHPRADWPDVMLAEIEQQARTAKRERGPRGVAMSNSYAGIFDHDGAGKRGQNLTEAKDQRPASPLDGPEGWHARLAELCPANAFTDPTSDRYTTRWHDLPIEARAIILKDAGTNGGQAA